MAEEPVDRRGLFRDLFRQATDAIVPVVGARLEPFIGAPAAPAAPAASVEQLLLAAGRLGLEARCAAIERLARRSLRLAPAVGAPTGELQFGGLPLMAEDQEWPTWQGRQLTFLAQVEAGEGLGRLLFFYDVLGRPSGCLAAHRGSARVLRADAQRLLPVDGPALPPAAMGGRATVELVIPSSASAAVGRLELSETERDAWELLRGELAALQGAEPPQRPGAVFRPAHRILGYADAPDGEMELTCELAAAGEDVIEGRAHLSPKAGELVDRAGRWQLLAQFSGDGKLGWPWVAQRVHFWVDRAALAAGELEPVWAIAR